MHSGPSVEIVLAFIRIIRIITLMSTSELTKRVKAWADRIGEKQALKELVTADIGPSTAEKLVRGTYVSTPKKIAKTLEAILSKEIKAS